MILRTEAERTLPPAPVPSWSGEIQRSMSWERVVSKAPRLVTVALPSGSKMRRRGDDVGSLEVDCSVSRDGGVQEDSECSRVFGS